MNSPASRNERPGAFRVSDGQEFLPATYVIGVFGLVLATVSDVHDNRLAGFAERTGVGIEGGEIRRRCRLQPPREVVSRCDPTTIAHCADTNDGATTLLHFAAYLQDRATCRQKIFHDQYSLVTELVCKASSIEAESVIHFVCPDPRRVDAL